MKYQITSFILLALLTCSDEHQETEALKGAAGIVRDSSATGPPLVLSYEQRQGKHLYKTYCAVCHGLEGKGDGFNAFNLDPKPRDFTDSRYMNAVTDMRLLEAISQGGRGVNKSVLMPSWGRTLTNLERTYVAAYIRSLAKRSD